MQQGLSTADNASYAKLLEYEQRSATFKPSQSQARSDANEWAGVIFRVGETRLTCNIDRIIEILPFPTFTTVPGAKPWILGLANVRGNLLTIVDLAWFLSGVRSPITMRTRILAGSLHGRLVGLLVDEVLGQRHFLDTDDGGTELNDSSFWLPVIRQDHSIGQETWSELDLDKLFTMTEFLNGAQS